MLALVTGADGFIGSHLVEALLSKGYDVRALSYYNSFNYLGWLEDIPPQKKLQIITGDIRDPHFCNKFTRNADLIFHLAALIGIPYSYTAPDSYIDTNIKGTMNICQAALENHKTRILSTSTSEVYGTAQYVPMDEKHPKQPQSPYSASKIGADMIALSFYHSFQLPVSIVRPFNTYGPRQSTRAVIPTVITQLASGSNTIKLGNVTPTRDFNFVKDTVEGFLSLAECDEAIGKEINVASNSEHSIDSVVKMICDLMNKKVEVVFEDQRHRPTSSEVFRLFGDNSFIKSITNWQPKHSIQQGLQNTIEWYLKSENLKKFKTDRYHL